MISDNSRVLRALKMNAIFSACCAMIMVIAADWVAVQLGLAGATHVYIVAAVLVLFVVQLTQLVRTRRIQRWEITAIIIADIAWVVASFALVIAYYERLTPAGLLLVDIVAVAVLVFAIQQMRGLREYLAGQRMHGQA
jgi:hypothetical protein